MKFSLLPTRPVSAGLRSPGLAGPTGVLLSSHLPPALQAPETHADTLFFLWQSHSG